MYDVSRLEKSMIIILKLGGCLRDFILENKRKKREVMSMKKGSVSNKALFMRSNFTLFGSKLIKKR